MPRFVPVVDNETPQLERLKNNNSDYDKHRKFDNPHSLQNNSNKKVVDRGWQQGNVGWGVLGSFGSAQKDDSAQVVSRSSGSGKMVRNEKGLWVKAKEIDDVVITKSSGAGRGGGIPLYQHAVANSLSHSSSSVQNFDPVIPNVDKSMLWKSASSVGAPDQFRDRSESPNRRDSRREEKLDPRDSGRRSDERRREYKEQIHNGQRHATRSRSRSRSRDRRDRDRGRDSDRRRDSNHKDDYRRDDRKRDDSRNRDNKQREHKRDDRNRGSINNSNINSGTSRMGDRSGHAESDNRDHRDRRPESGRDQHTERRDSRDYRDTSSRDKRSETTTRNSNDVHSRDEKRSNTAKEVNRNYGEDEEEEDDSRHDNESEVEADEDDEEEDVADIPFSITAIQVVNRLHEVFAKQTLFFSERVDSIAELFTESAVIGSLKNENNVYLKGRAAIKDSFLKTTAATPTISKRVFIDTSADATPSSSSSSFSETVSPSQTVTFVFDLHRAGTAPGLGDKTKDTLLLYRCVDAHITTIWGMVDVDKMSSNSDLTDAQLFTSDVWSGPVTRIVQRDMPSFSVLRAGHAVYNNYDHMETWG